MPLKSQFSALSTRLAAAALVIAMSGSGRPVFAFEQAPTPPAPAPLAPSPQLPPSGPELQLTADDAVKMALENNLGIQAARLSPEVQALALSQTRSAYTPVIFSTTSKNSNTTPPSDFLSAASDFVTSEGFRTSGGIGQQLKWGGGNYQLSLDGLRNSSNDPRDPFNPRLDSRFNFNFTQPLLRNLTIDATRQQLLVGEKQREIIDVQLQQQITQTARRVRSAYFDLLRAIGQLGVARQTLALSQRALKDNEARVEVGTVPPIDILETQAEVSRNEEGVIINEAQIKTLEDNLRTLIMNPTQGDFWTARIVPVDQPQVSPEALDVDAAVANALSNRTDIAQARKELEQTDIGIKFARNQKLPAVNAIVNYGLAGVGGTRTLYDNSQGFPIPTGTAQRSFSDALSDIFGNEFKTWSLQLQVSYPIGTSTADAALAQARVQRQQDMTTLRQLEMLVTTSVRDAARQVETSLKRVESTRKAREFAERHLEAEQKRINVGLSTTFQLLQAQRRVSEQRLSELNAIIDYNRALVNFQTVQQAPLIGR
jgi:outer membrane protein TolC